MNVVVCFSAALLMLPGLAMARPQPALVILAETGGVREGLPVYSIHADADSIAMTLTSGFSGRFLRLHSMQQHFLASQTGQDPQPAYLLLSGNQGGFPRFGFFLGDVDKRDVGYVDLHRGSPVAGRFGALDQIFPHELAHVIVQQLAGEPAGQYSTQIHAVGVTTDRVTAFHEGFAEHLQILAVDDPDADPRTRQLLLDAEIWPRTRRRLATYQRELSARWSPATRMRMTFPLWFSGADQAMRYHAVKANLFAREPPIPPTLLRQENLHSAYLLGHVLPGAPDSKPRTAARMLACEGVVAALFHIWATSRTLGERYEDDPFYAQFGVSSSDVDPLDNVYLKIFYTLYQHKPRDTAELIRAYGVAFRHDAAALDSVVAQALLGQSLPRTEPLWIENPHFQVGTSLFDQFRKAPRYHIFDLNAASVVDLSAIPGVDSATAQAILDNGPYERVEQLAERAAVDVALVSRFGDMQLDGERASQDEIEGGVMDALRRILFSYMWRALGAWATAALCSAFLYRRLRRSGWLRAAFAALGASLLGLVAAWLIDAPGGSMAVAVPVLFLGLPAAAWRFLRTGSFADAVPTLVAWTAACLPAALLAQPLF